MKKDALRPRTALPSPRLKMIPLSAISLPRAFGRAAPEDISRLAESVRRYGLLQPIGVCRKRGFPARYDLLFGHRRLLACRALYLPSVPCLVFPDRRESALYSLCENFQRENAAQEMLADAALRLSLPLSDLCSRLCLPCPETEKSAQRREISFFLEEETMPASPPARCRGVVRDARLVANSIERAVCAGRDAGVAVELQKVCQGGELSYHIRLQLSGNSLFSAQTVRSA